MAGGRFAEIGVTGRDRQVSGVESYRWTRRVGRPHGTGWPVVGAIDLGTNNCRLLVARLEPQGFKVIDAFSRIVRLGEGLAHADRLSEAAMARCMDALQVCAEKLHRRGAEHLRAVATEACRQGSNSAAFVGQVAQQTGIALEVIPEIEEVRLAADGCAPLIEPGKSDVLIFDIGGGSTEISWVKVESGAPQGVAAPGVTAAGVARRRVAVRDWCSLPIGVVSFAERYGGGEVAPVTYRAMVEESREAAAAFDRRHDLSRSLVSGAFQMIGTSGTVTTLAGLSLQLPRYDRNRVDGQYLTLQEILRLNGEISAMSLEARRANACIGGDRADLVIAGCAILEGLLQVWPAPRLRVADRGLREGILLQLERGLRPKPYDSDSAAGLRDRRA